MSGQLRDDRQRDPLFAEVPGLGLRIMRQCSLPGIVEQDSRAMSPAFLRIAETQSSEGLLGSPKWALLNGVRVAGPVLPYGWNSWRRTRRCSMVFAPPRAALSWRRTRSMWLRRDFTLEALNAARIAAVSCCSRHSMLSRRIRGFLLARLDGHMSRSVQVFICPRQETEEREAACKAQRYD